MATRHADVIVADLTLRHADLLITIQAAESDREMRINIQEGSLLTLLRQAYPFGWFRTLRWLKKSSKLSGRNVSITAKGRQILRFKP